MEVPSIQKNPYELLKEQGNFYLKQELVDNVDRWIEEVFSMPKNNLDFENLKNRTATAIEKIIDEISSFANKITFSNNSQENEIEDLNQLKNDLNSRKELFESKLNELNSRIENS